MKSFIQMKSNHEKTVSGNLVELSQNDKTNHKTIYQPISPKFSSVSMKKKLVTLLNIKKHGKTRARIIYLKLSLKFKQKPILFLTKILTSDSDTSLVFG